MTAVYLEICLQTKLSIIIDFYYQLMHKRIVLKWSIKIYIKITIAATRFGVYMLPRFII